jgi:hypothetical protein
VRVSDMPSSSRTVSPAILCRPMPRVARSLGSSSDTIAAAQTREFVHVEFEGTTKRIPSVRALCLKEGQFELSQYHQRTSRHGTSREHMG